MLGALQQRLRPVAVRLRYPRLGPHLNASRRASGWIGIRASVELASVVRSLPEGATIVEVGSFVGRSAIVIAAAGRHRGATLHCVDPFDGSGDEHSREYYASPREGAGATLLETFSANVQAAGVADAIEVHVGTGEEIGRQWHGPVDMLYLDGDQSVEGVNSTFDAWFDHLAPGTIVACFNSGAAPKQPGHDGHQRLVAERLQPPAFATPERFGELAVSRRL